MKIMVFLLLVSTLDPGAFPRAGTSEAVRVSHAGALRDIMHKGDTSAKILLQSLPLGPDFYALGALEKLDGEILILGGEISLARTRENRVALEHDPDQGAALLVYATVEVWQKVGISDPIDNIRGLEERIALEAARSGLDLSEPFPFIIRGRVAKAEWHVVAESEAGSPQDHQSHRDSGVSGVLAGEKVAVLGFFSTGHQGVFTHFNSRVHMHIQPQDKRLAGHLDQIRLDEGFTLSLPASAAP